MILDSFRWIWHRRDEKEKFEGLLLEEIQALKKLLRRQSVLIEEVRRDQEAFASREHQINKPLLELCDAVFHLQHSFRNPGLMSRQHVHVLSMVFKKLEQFAGYMDLQIILEEGVPFDPRIHESVFNRNPGSHSLDVLEVIQPGYLQDGKVIRPAKVVVGTVEDSVHISEGAAPS